MFDLDLVLHALGVGGGGSMWVGHIEAAKVGNFMRVAAVTRLWSHVTRHSRHTSCRLLALLTRRVQSLAAEYLAWTGLLCPCSSSSSSSSSISNIRSTHHHTINHWPNFNQLPATTSPRQFPIPKEFLLLFYSRQVPFPHPPFQFYCSTGPTPSHPSSAASHSRPLVSLCK